MNNNRSIIISTGNSRKSTTWKKEQLTWFEFAEKLKSPSRGSETLEEYMNLPKSSQDDLKDVGGFVGGELLEGRRKNNNVVLRDLITLDLDNIEAGKTEDVLKKINQKGDFVLYVGRPDCKDCQEFEPVFPSIRLTVLEKYLFTKSLDKPIASKFCDPR